MNRIDKKLKEVRDKNQKALVAFLTAGDPNMDMTEEFIYRLENHGADIIELGIPFSDPSSDGPVIQEADIRAIENGTDIFKVFEFTEKIRNKVSLPIIYSLYYNVIIQYGVDAFFKKCSDVGVDAVIIPDLPYEESSEISEYTEKYGIYQIQMLSPTAEERIAKIAGAAKGFIYCVCSGEPKQIDDKLADFFKSIKKYTDLPVCTGFYTSTKECVSEIKKYCDGIITGSELVKAAAGNDKISALTEKITEYKEWLN